MSRRLFELVEQVLLVILAGFVFWPNAISSSALILLLVIAVVRARAELFRWKDAWILIPPVAVSVAWIFHGADMRGIPEVQLWATWVAGFVVFKTTRFASLFGQAFTVFSFLQALMVLFALTFYEGLSPDRFSFDLRDMIDARFHLHPTYLSAAWLWAALLLLFERPFTQGIRIIMVVLLVVLALMMGGKMPFLAFIVALGLYTIIRISSLRKRGLALLIIGVIAVMNVVYNPMLNQRFGELVAPRTEFVDGQWLSSTEVRLGVWKCAWNVASNQWLTGVGVGKTRYSLEACYAKYNQQEFLDVELNSHNQFIHFVLIGGVFAGLAFLGTLLGFAYTAILRQHYELIVLLVFSGLIMLTENYLTRQSGMMLIAFGIMSRYFPVSRVQPS